MADGVGPASSEVEWQLDAVDLRPVERWLATRGPEASPRIEPGPVQELLDTYLDTEDWRLYRAGWSLRVRERDGSFRATLKSFARAVDGRRERREIEEDLPVGGAEGPRDAPGEVGTRVRALAGRRPLRVLFEIVTRRHDHAVTVDDATAAVLSLDDTAIPVSSDERPARLQRVEVELVGAEHEDAVRKLADELRTACGLRPADTSKFQAGLLARGLVPPSPADLGPEEITADSSIGELAFAVLRQQFAAFLAHEPGTRLGEDPEELHDMRVATRRMRAAMSVFRDVLPVRAQSLRDELKWVAGALGAVRDLDVHLEQLDEWTGELPVEDRGGLEAIVELTRARRERARAELLQALDSRRFERLVASMSGMLRRGPLRRSPASRQPALLTTPELVADRRRKFRKRGDALGRDAAPEDLHKLRIRGKRLRYTVEFVSPLYGKAADPLVKRLSALQDVLGAHQDARVAVEFIRSLLDEHAADLSVGSVFALGRVAERYRIQEAEERSRFPKAYAAVKGAPWRKLRKAMSRKAERARAALPPPRRRTPSPSLEPAPAAPTPTEASESLPA